MKAIHYNSRCSVATFLPIPHIIRLDSSIKGDLRKMSKQKHEDARAESVLGILIHLTVRYIMTISREVNMLIQLECQATSFSHQENDKCAGDLVKGMILHGQGCLFICFCLVVDGSTH